MPFYLINEEPELLIDYILNVRNEWVPFRPWWRTLNGQGELCCPAGGAGGEKA